MGTEVAGFVSIATFIAAVLGGLFAFVKWLDQRQRELQEHRFDQYWKLIDIAQECPTVAKQKIALLLLKRYPEFKHETVEVLTDARNRNDPWTTTNKIQIDSILTYFTST